MVPATPPSPESENAAAERRAAFSWRARAGSFRYAWRGVYRLLRREHNAWLHLVAAVAAVALGAALSISRLEWCAVVFAIAAVLGAEAFNTAIETLADAVHPDRDPLVGQAKDLAAAGVLLVSLGAAAVGLIVFAPRLLALLATHSG